MNKRQQPRLFLDSNVLIDAFKAEFGLSKAIISLAWSQLVRLVIGQVVLDEVEDNLLRYSLKVPKDRADRLLKSWDEFVRRAKPEIIPPASKAEIASKRHLIRHRNDVPVLLAALTAQPDWLLTTNRDHFTNDVAKTCGIRIADPEEWFIQLINTAEI